MNVVRNNSMWIAIVALAWCQGSANAQLPASNPWHFYQPPGRSQPLSASSSFDAMSTLTTTPASCVDGSCVSCLSPFGNNAYVIADQGFYEPVFVTTNIDPFGDFISPITNPVYFEDPRNLTEFRAIFIQQKVPLPAGCGDFQVYAGQLRASLSQNLSFIVNKAGYVSSRNSFVDDGWLDFSAGLKLNLVQDAGLGKLLSTGFTFETPTGASSALQGNGDGELHVFLSGAQRLGNCAHWMSGFGARIPMNSTDESQSLYWSNHWDYRVNQRFYLLTELNWFHWLKAGQDGCLCYEGLELFNLGTPGVAGNDIVTAAVGTKYKTDNNSELGFAFEFPLTERRDILDNRITVDWIVRF